jgi:hypothetical protein
VAHGSRGRSECTLNLVDWRAIARVSCWHITDMQAAWDNVFSAYESGPQFELHQNQSNGKKNSEFSHQYAHAREEFLRTQ